VHSHLAVMPDVHVGKGATVGSVIATKGAIIPAAVGVDIGCGMMAVQTTLKAKDLPESLASLRARIERAIPHGSVSVRGRAHKGSWGIAPDSDVIGYTDANNNKVGMLVPHDSGMCVSPNTEPTDKLLIDATVTTMPTTVASDVTPGIPKTVMRKTTTKQDGTFVEAVLNASAPNADPTLTPPDSMSPLGITPVKWKGQGTFFYAVGMTGRADPTAQGGPSYAKRVGFVRLGIPEKIKNPRDDDDADDGMDKTHHPGWHSSEPGDDDADGVPDEHDTPTNRENMTAYDPAPAAPMSATEYQVATTATTLALIATATSDDPTATIAVDIYNAVGTLVATSAPLPGLAGNSGCRGRRDVRGNGRGRSCR